HQVLTTQVHTYESQTTACRGNPEPLTCVTNADRVAADGFGSFVQVLDNAPVPTTARAQADRLASIGTRAQQIFEQLASSTSANQYQQTVQSSNLSNVLASFDRDYSELETALGA